MHPWKKIVNGNTKEKEATSCFMCLELIPFNSDETINKFQEHMTQAHSATCSMKKLAEMCAEAEEKEEREGLNLNDIIKEERERQEAAMKRRSESGGLLPRHPRHHPPGMLPLPREMARKKERRVRKTS